MNAQIFTCHLGQERVVLAVSLPPVKRVILIIFVVKEWKVVDGEVACNLLLRFLARTSLGCWYLSSLDLLAFDKKLAMVGFFFLAGGGAAAASGSAVADSAPSAVWVPCSLRGGVAVPSQLQLRTDS